MLRKFSKWIFILSIFAVVGCTSEQEKLLKRVESRVVDAERAVVQLKSHLRNGTMRNAKLLVQYGAYLKRQKPDLAEIIDTLQSEGTVNGLMLNNLQHRFSQAKLDSTTVARKDIIAASNTYNELDSIIEAASPNSFNMMLTDQINVLADMSDGKLSRVESMSKEASLAANKSKDYGAGSQLVGNPNYGSWHRNSNGSSAWTWFAAYAMFNSMNRSPIYYDRWSRNRDYSYYGSVGRHHYISPKQKTSQTQLDKNYKDKFSKQGKKFQSPYAKNKITTAKVSQQRKVARRTASNRRAGFSSNRQGTASSRSASSRTSRSSSRGK